MVPPLTLTGYSRPFTNVIVGISPACDSWTIANLFACEISLHDMTASYIPMVQALYTTALKKLS